MLPIKGLGIEGLKISGKGYLKKQKHSLGRQRLRLAFKVLADAHSGEISASSLPGIFPESSLT